MREDDEGEDRALLDLQRAIAPRVTGGEAWPRAERFRAALEVIRDSMDARSAALLLLESEGSRLQAATVVGLGREALEGGISSMRPSALFGHATLGPRSVEVADVETTDMEVSSSVRESGLHALLATRVAPRGRLWGVLWVGVAERRSFTPREIVRFEALAECFSLHLEGDLVASEIRHELEELHRERAIREQYVSMLAHDLRGPLAVARLSAEVLSHGILAEAVVQDMVERIGRNLDRIDRMIRDLLDASRIRAGLRPKLQLEICDLGLLAREVADELLPMHGERFVVRADDGVRGVWSRETLRRALWNLATNAVKYGAANAPVTIRVHTVERSARISVHNDGTPIPLEDQQHLFAPFARADSAHPSANSWGLGLTLVSGCAEAHGGRASVASGDGIGTTFTIEIPLDARPFQPLEVAGPV